MRGTTQSGRPTLIALSADLAGHVGLCRWCSRAIAGKRTEKRRTQLCSDGRFIGRKLHRELGRELAPAR